MLGTWVGRRNHLELFVCRNIVDKKLRRRLVKQESSVQTKNNNQKNFPISTREIWVERKFHQLRVDVDSLGLVKDIRHGGDSRIEFWVY